MTTNIKVVQELGPKIVPGQPVGTGQLIETMMRNSGQSKGECRQALTNVIESMTIYLKEGRSVHLDEWGSFAPDIKLNGDFAINYREAADLVEEVRNGFTGVIKNAENIGKTMAELIAIWNADPAHADDQIPTS